jgi:hypothetical protein
LRELIQKMMNINVAERLTIEEVGRCAWVADEGVAFGGQAGCVVKSTSFERRPAGRNAAKADFGGASLIRKPGIPQSLSGIQKKVTLAAQLEGLLRRVPPSRRPRPVGRQKTPGSRWSEAAAAGREEAVG